MTSSLEMIEDDRIVAKCYVELGNVTKEKGEYDESLRYHRKSMEIFERIDDALSVADSHLNLAEIYKAKGELKQAMSEYEKGLTLYEDVYVEDANKNSDSGTDISLNSSSFSDLQHTRSLSKSDETLPHTRIEKNPPVVSSMVESITSSTSSLNLINSTAKKMNGFDGIPQSIDDSSLVHSEKIRSERRKSISTSTLSDLQYINANDMFPPFSPGEIDCQRSGEITPAESEILEIALPSVYTIQTNLSKSIENKIPTTDTKQSASNTEKIEIRDNTSQFWHCLPNKQFLIILLCIFLTGVFCWSLNDNAISSIDSLSHRKSSLNDSEDLRDQLQKILFWRKEKFIGLNKESRHFIEEFLTNSNAQPTITLEKFQRILNMLELKIILIPQ